MINPYILQTHKDRLVNDAFDCFKFNEEKHFFSDKHGTKFTSITRILKAMGITPDYSTVDEEVLDRAIKYGNFIHKNIEDFVKEDKKGIADELESFIDYAKIHELNFVASEYKVHLKNYAGIIDLIYTEKGELVISDIKTTATVHRDAVSWQLSLYNYLLGENIQKATCIHIRPNLFEVLDIPLKSYEECEKFLNDFENGEAYSVAIMEEQQIAKLFELQETLKLMDQQKKLIEDKINAFKQALLVNMQEKNLLKVELENDDKKLTITRVMPKDKETIDYESLLKDNPQINIDHYKKYTPVKEYVKISG